MFIWYFKGVKKTVKMNFKRYKPNWFLKDNLRCSVFSQFLQVVPVTVVVDAARDGGAGVWLPGYQLPFGGGWCC